MAEQGLVDDIAGIVGEVWDTATGTMRTRARDKVGEYLEGKIEEYTGFEVEIEPGEPGSKENPYEMAEVTVEAAPVNGESSPGGQMRGNTYITHNGKRFRLGPDGKWYPAPRRRRRRMLTCSDRADIAFLRSTLGGGETGRAAITAILSRCT